VGFLSRRLESLRLGRQEPQGTCIEISFVRRVWFGDPYFPIEVNAIEIVLINESCNIVGKSLPVLWEYCSSENGIGGELVS